MAYMERIEINLKKKFIDIQSSGLDYRNINYYFNCKGDYSVFHYNPKKQENPLI